MLANNNFEQVCVAHVCESFHLKVRNNSTRSLLMSFILVNSLPTVQQLISLYFSRSI